MDNPLIGNYSSDNPPSRCLVPLPMIVRVVGEWRESTILAGHCLRTSIWAGTNSSHVEDQYAFVRQVYGRPVPRHECVAMIFADLD